MKNRTLTLILCLTAYALAGSYLFAQSTGPLLIETSGTNKGKIANPLFVPANSGTGANQFANGADTQAALNSKVSGTGGTATNLAVTGSDSTIVIPGVLDTTTGVLGDGDKIINWDSGFLGWDSETVLDWQTRKLHGVWEIVSQYSDEIVIASGLTPTWNLNSGINARFTATSNATFSISNIRGGQVGTLSITQASGTSPFTMTFPVGTKQAFGGTNTYQMSGTNVTDILYFYRTGTNTVITGVVPGIVP